MAYLILKASHWPGSTASCPALCTTQCRSPHPSCLPASIPLWPPAYQTGGWRTHYAEDRIGLQQKNTLPQSVGDFSSREDKNRKRRAYLHKLLGDPVKIAFVQCGDSLFSKTSAVMLCLSCIVISWEVLLPLMWALQLFLALEGGKKVFFNQRPSVCFNSLWK